MQKMWPSLVVMIICMASCASNRKTVYVKSSGKNVLDSIIESDSFLNAIASRKDSLRIQIIYTQINRDKNNKPQFTTYKFNVDPHLYFYPASTVKMPVAVLALEKLHELGIPGLNKFTNMRVDSTFGYPALQTSVAECVKRIFLVSDNDAFNHLYEFLGQQYIRERLSAKGYPGAEIRHRLNIFLTPEENRQTSSVTFIDSVGNNIYRQPAQYSKAVFSDRSDLIGESHVDYDGNYIDGPFDFSSKNRISLTDLTAILRTILFPESVPVSGRFHLTSEDYRFLYRYMSGYPSESPELRYDSAEFPDSYVKLLLYGAGRAKPDPNVRIFNKEGDAYGFLTDVAYVVDFNRKIEFMLSATIFCDTDGVVNDDQYAYDSIGYPFLQKLGEAVYRYERERKRERVPDLGRFQVDYSSVSP